jgi:acetyl esterase
VIESIGADATSAPVDVAAVAERAVPTAAGPVAVRIYRPRRAGDAPPSLLMWMHGGGFVLGDLDGSDATARELCAGTDAIVANVGYPLAPEHRFPEAAHACHAVAAWLAAHHSEIGFDPARLAVGGDSAGGNLAAVTALLAARRGGPAICLQLLVYPMLDMVGDHPSMRENGEGYLLSAVRIEWFKGQYLRDAGDRTDPLASPLHAPDLAGQPPAIVVTAELDPLRDEAEAYAERLRSAGVEVLARRHDGLVHGFLQLGALSPAASAAIRETIAATRARLYGAPNTNAGSASRSSGSA